LRSASPSEPPALAERPSAPFCAILDCADGSCIAEVDSGIFCAGSGCAFSRPAAGSGRGPWPRATCFGGSSTRSGLLPRENGSGFSGFFARSGEAAARLRSDGSARSGALATGRSTRGATIMYCSGGSGWV